MQPKYHESVHKVVEDLLHASMHVVAPWARTGPSLGPIFGSAKVTFRHFRVVADFLHYRFRCVQLLT